MRIPWERLGRFDFTPVLYGHWKALTLDSPGFPADLLARSVLLILSGGLGILSICLDWSLHAPAALLTGISLLVGGSLSVFTHLSTLRLRLTDRADDPSLDFDRAAFDESAAHLLTAALLAVLDAVVLVIAMNVGIDETGAIRGFWSGFVIAISTYLALLFVMLIPRLYNAYVNVNHVADYLNGFHKPAS